MVRQQLLVDPAIPYTSHNSSACAVLESRTPPSCPELIEIAIAIIEENFFEGSDPGLCVATEADTETLARLVAFGELAAVAVTTKEAARGPPPTACTSPSTAEPAAGSSAQRLASGLTHDGWAGRLIEYHRPFATSPPRPPSRNS